MRLRTLLVALIALCMGCDGGTRGTGTTITVRGLVLNLDGAPSSHVVVSLDALDAQRELIDTANVIASENGSYDAEVAKTSSLRIRISAQGATASLPVIDLPDDVDAVESEIQITSPTTAEFNFISVDSAPTPSSDPAVPTPTPGTSDPNATPTPNQPSTPSATPSSPSATPTVTPPPTGGGPVATPTPTPSLPPGQGGGSTPTPTPNPTESPTPDPGGGSDLVTICHMPGGNPNNAHTIEVPESAVAAHLAHGDHLGAC